MPAPNTQQLIEKIQGAGYTLGVDAYPDGSMLCQIYGPLDKDGGQESLVSNEGKLLHKTILRCWVQVSKRGEK
ncbi:MAG: hypothetical protein SV201_04825 [Pseudomonadota bacterium]|nr:hypothetical protein [Pseudomonadota bacterium]